MLKQKKNLGYQQHFAKLIVTFTILFVVVVAAEETRAHVPNYGSTACGPAYLLFENSPSGTSNALAATTNGTLSPTQTFAMSSQTSGCSDKYGKVAYRQREQEAFAAVNWHSLKQEMAAGQGEKLEAFATLLGCPTADGAFAQHSRRNHENFFQGVSAKRASQFVTKVKTSIQSEPSLANSCNLV